VCGVGDGLNASIDASATIAEDAWVEQAELMHRNGGFYLCTAAEKDILDSKPTNAVVVDLGIKHLVASLGTRNTCPSYTGKSSKTESVPPRSKPCAAKAR
jgi:hypothetical protein